MDDAAEAARLRAAGVDYCITNRPAALRDTRDYYEHDIRFIIIVTLIVVLVILMALLRAIVAPLYLVGSVVISYFAALGISVLTFQYLLGPQLHWRYPHWPSWYWSRWAPTTTCHSYRECATSLRTACVTASFAP